MPNLKLTNIQILRGLAAVWVVVFHAIGESPHPYPVSPFLEYVGRYGYFGVDLFFVLSGFVICYSVHAKPISATTFFMRRAERIVPPYLVLTIVLFLVMLAFPNIFHSMKASLDHFVRSATYLSFTRYEYPVLYVGWTLEYEMFFYLMAAGALACSARVFNKVPMAICGVVLCGLLFKQAGGHSAPVEFLTNPVVLEFCFGFITAAVFLTRKLDGQTVAALIATVLAVSIIDPTHRVILAGVPSVILLCICLALNSRVTLPSYVRNPLASIGDASYSIYLIQVFALPIADRSRRLFPGAEGPILPTLLAIGFTIFVGWAFFRFVERPMLNIIRARRQGGAASPVAIVVK